MGLKFRTLEKLSDGKIGYVDRVGEELKLGFEGRGEGGEGEELRFALDRRKAAGAGTEEWVVTELSTGLKLCGGPGREEAVRAMMGTEEGRWAVNEMVKRWTERG